MRSFMYALYYVHVYIISKNHGGFVMRGVRDARHLVGWVMVH